MNWRALWAVARNDLAVWRRSPWAVAAALVPALGMGVLVGTLTLSVTQQPVALVVEGNGQATQLMESIVKSDTDAYILRVVGATTADEMLESQQVAAVIVIPANFDSAIRTDSARIDLYLNDIDYDFSDDIRRSVTRSAGEFDAPGLSLFGEIATGQQHAVVLPNVYRVAVAEDNLRQTNVGFIQYQTIPIILLLIINVGVLGTALLTARDFERGTARLLLLAPASRTTIVLGRGLGSVLASLALVVPMVALATVVGFVSPPVGHWPAVVALLLATILMSVGLGLVIGTALRQSRLVTMVGLNVVTCLFFLGGGFATIAFLPNWIQTLSRFVPASYAIGGLRQALFYPDLVGFGTDLIVLSGVAIGSVVVGSIALSLGLTRT